MTDKVNQTLHTTLSKELSTSTREEQAVQTYTLQITDKLGNTHIFEDITWTDNETIQEVEYISRFVSFKRDEIQRNIIRAQGLVENPIEERFYYERREYSGYIYKCMCGTLCNHPISIECLIMCRHCNSEKIRYTKDECSQCYELHHQQIRISQSRMNSPTINDENGDEWTLFQEEEDELYVGRIILFTTRPNGEKTLGEIKKINKTTIRVEGLSIRKVKGKEYPIGKPYVVQLSCVYVYDDDNDDNMDLYKGEVN